KRSTKSMAGEPGFEPRLTESESAENVQNCNEIKGHVANTEVSCRAQRPRLCSGSSFRRLRFEASPPLPCPASGLPLWAAQSRRHTCGQSPDFEIPPSIGGSTAHPFA